MRAIYLALILTLAASPSFAAELTKDALATVKKNIEDGKAVLVDVREKSEWDAGHLEGSIFAPLSSLKNPAELKQLQVKLPKDKILYTFCVAGVRAVTAGNIVEKLGYESRPLKPGYKELIKARFEKAAD